MTARVVIVGAGQAGTTVATSLRDYGYDGSITVVGNERHLPYERPPLSKQYLSNGPSDSGIDLVLRPDAFYREREITLMLGRTVVGVDRHNRSVVLDDGNVLAYTALVLATGTRPVIPPLVGTDLEGVHVLRTLDDAARLRDQLFKVNHLTAVGGGFIGLELAAAANKLGVEACVVDIADRVLQRAITPITSAYLTDVHRQRGTALHLGTGVTEILGSTGRVSAVLTTTGQRISTDAVVLAMGVRPNTELAIAAGLEVDNGVVVDEYLRSSDSDIFAIGDCANFPDSFSGERVRFESVQAATDHARSVARQVAGQPAEPYRALPWFWSHQGPTRLNIAGYTGKSDVEVVRGDPSSGKFSVLRYLGGRLMAVESINRPADHVAARRLLAHRASPSPKSAIAATDLRSLIPPETVTA